jgi:hypothetical protein
MKPKEKINTIRFPMYGYEIIVVITSDILHSRNKRQDEIGGPLKDNRQPLGLHSYNPEYSTSFIFLNPNTTIGTIVHEANHAVYRMFRWIGAVDVDEEIISYTLGYIVEEIVSMRN